MTTTEKVLAALDRTAVLFIGLAAGAVITFSFFAGNDPDVASPVVQATPASVAPDLRPASLGAAPGPSLAAAAAQDRSVHIGVFGDSFADGIWWALNRQLREDDVVEVHRFSRPATGFTGYRNANLLDEIRGKIDRQPIDIAVISFGANDAQGIYSNGVSAEFMSETWQRMIGERVDSLVRLMRERGTMVYWVGLPRMRLERYDANIQRMNAFYTERMRALNVPFIDTASISVDGQGRYAPYLPDPQSGRLTAMRTNDGIHMTMSGYTILTQALADSLRTTISSAREQAARIGGRHVGNSRQRGARSQT